MNGDKIKVNGAIMDRDYFYENVKEANSYEWEIATHSDVKKHSHCIVCSVALPNSNHSTFYISGTANLCEFCYANYVNKLDT